MHPQGKCTPFLISSNFATANDIIISTSNVQHTAQTLVETRD
jgi:hypothetical protein